MYSKDLVYKAIASARKLAEGLRTDAAYGGRMDDGGASNLEAQITAFEAGYEGRIPFFLESHIAAAQHQAMIEANPEEYNEYKRLKAKFEKND